MVVQAISVYLCEDSVFEVERWFGNEKFDSTHSGLGGQWQTIRVNEDGHAGLIELSEDFYHSVHEPDVPEWR